MTDQEYSQQVNQATSGFCNHTSTTAMAYAIFYGIRLFSAALIRAVRVWKG